MSFFFFLKIYKNNAKNKKFPSPLRVSFPGFLIFLVSSGVVYTMQYHHICTRSVLYIESAEKILNRPGPARPDPARPEANTMRNYRFGYVFLASEKELRIRQIATRAHRAVFFLVTRFFDGPCYLFTQME